MDDGGATPEWADWRDVAAAVPPWLSPFADKEAVHSDEGGLSGVGLRCSLAHGTEMDDLPKRRPSSDRTDEAGATGVPSPWKRTPGCHVPASRCGGTKLGACCFCCCGCWDWTDESLGEVEPDANESLRHTTALPLARMMARGRCTAGSRALPTMAAPELELAEAGFASRTSADGRRDKRPLGEAEPDRSPDSSGDMGDMGGEPT